MYWLSVCYTNLSYPFFLWFVWVFVTQQAHSECARECQTLILSLESNESETQIPFLMEFCHSPMGWSVCNQSVSAVSPCLNRRVRSCGHTWLYPQCLLRISAGFLDPSMKRKDSISEAIASRTRWNDKAVCRLCSLASGLEELLTTDSLSPNM